MFSSAEPRVAVIGGGVVGLCCAYELRALGADVLLLERDECGSGASWGNAGWIVPALAAPLAAPGGIRRALAGMLEHDSPVRIRPRADRELVRWIRHFSRSSSHSGHASGLNAKVVLGAETMRQFDALAASGVEFEMHQTGLLAVALTEAGLREAEHDLGAAFAAGYPGEMRMVDGTELRELEPAVSKPAVGGLLLEHERHVRPDTLVRGLRTYLLDQGVDIRERAKALSLTRLRTGWELCETSRVHRADRVVIAAGSWSAALLRPLGFKLLLQPARGCSITATGRGLAPTRALKLLEARVACSPFDGAVRLSGMFELNGMDPRLDERRLRSVIRTASPYLQNWAPEDVELRWAGLRAVSPDDLPFIGSVPGHSDLFVATGHGTLGLILAPATASLLAPLVMHGERANALEPFRPGRFDAHTRR